MPCNIKIRIDATNITKIDEGIMRQVANELAAAGNGRVTTYAGGGASNWFSGVPTYGARIESDCGIAIRTMDVPDGIAINIRDGRLTFAGSSSGAAYNKLRDSIPNAYVDKVIESSLRGMHMLLTKTDGATGMEYRATDLAGRQLLVLRRPDGKVKFDYGDGYDDAAYHETSDALKTALSNLGVQTEMVWSQEEDPEKWLTQEIALLGKDN